ncbi:hypothetical protein [Runella zeae]|uniref:hypothetical protein n=1 Tax=Runella zeae TaxID=94255 RepID=UPI0004048DD7|nr:hypothetical protein [Runella zeae]
MNEFTKFLAELGGEDIVAGESLIHCIFSIPKWEPFEMYLWVDICPLRKWFYVNLMVFEHIIPLVPHSNYSDFDDFVGQFQAHSQIKATLDFIKSSEVHTVHTL